MKLGFAGTRKGMSVAQRRNLAIVLSWFRGGGREFHSGGSGDSDIEAQRMAHAAGYHVHVHPCPGVTAEGSPPDYYWHEVFPPLVRDRHIAEACYVLVAAPLRDKEQLRSGTWATVRYAREAEKPVIMLPRGRQ